MKGQGPVEAGIAEPFATMSLTATSIAYAAPVMLPCVPPCQSGGDAMRPSGGAAMRLCMAPARIAHNCGNKFLTRRAQCPGHLIAARIGPGERSRARGAALACRATAQPNEDLAMTSLSFAADRQPAQSLMMAVVARLQRALERRRAIAELAGLDDRMLSDIGVSRADIPQIVDGYRY
jgi:uncharacterized protein YjiS (DUF1127 family)